MAGHRKYKYAGTSRPKKYDAELHPILDFKELYDGCVGRVSVAAFTFSVPGSAG
jgi:hypothetical protein